MAFWKGLFGSKKPAGMEPSPPTSLFDAALRDSVARYTSMQQDGAALDPFLRHPATGERADAAALFPDPCREWSTVLSPWDRRRILFAVLDPLLDGQLAVWQRAERWVEDRRPREAVELLRATETAAEATTPRFAAAYAKALMCLDQPEESLRWARRGLDSDSSDRLRVLAADAEHLLGNTDAAHATYSELLAATPGSSSEREPQLSPKELSDELFSMARGAVRSPIFAVSIAMGAPDLWPFVEDEFYWSPYVRAQHAYQLAQTGDSMRAFAKLLSLVQEMPWLREASLNCIELFNAFDPDGSRGLRVEDRERILGIIQENDWSKSDLLPLEPIPFDIGAERRRMNAR